jgi:hypothetical protein
MADSKLILNVHRAELGYLEWHRILGAILNGCVVLSEPSIGFEPLVPGEHFVTVEYDDLPFALEALIGHEQRLESIRRAAYDLVRDQLPVERTAEVLVDAVEAAARKSLGTVGDWGLPTPSPVTLDPPKNGWEAHAEVVGAELPTRMALKHLVLRTRAIEQRLNRLDGSDEGPAEDIVEHLGPRRGNPRVSVLLTVYNYAEHIGAALRSVAVSKLTDIEVVVVDDASTDHSVEAQAAQRWPSRRPQPGRRACEGRPPLRPRCRQRSHAERPRPARRGTRLEPRREFRLRHHRDVR